MKVSLPVPNFLFWSLITHSAQEICWTDRRNFVPLLKPEGLNLWADALGDSLHFPFDVLAWTASRRSDQRSVVAAMLEHYNCTFRSNGMGRLQYWSLREPFEMLSIELQVCPQVVRHRWLQARHRPYLPVSGYCPSAVDRDVVVM